MPDNITTAELISTAEAALRLAKSPRTVLKLCDSGVLRFRRFGARTVLIEAASLGAARNVKRGRPKQKSPESRLAARLRKMGKFAMAEELEAAFASRRARDSKTG